MGCDLQLAFIAVLWERNAQGNFVSGEMSDVRREMYRGLFAVGRFSKGRIFSRRNVWVYGGIFENFSPGECLGKLYRAKNSCISYSLV